MAMALVPASDGKKVRPGDKVFIDPASVRRDVYGQVKGVVASVSSNPVTPDLLRNILRNEDLVKKMTEAGPAFLATVAMQRDPGTSTGYAWTSSRGPDGSLTAGTPPSCRDSDGAGLAARPSPAGAAPYAARRRRDMTLAPVTSPVSVILRDRN